MKINYLAVIVSAVIHFIIGGLWYGLLRTAFLFWLGFVATTQLATVVLEQRKLGLYLLNVGYQLVAGLVVGAILARWKPRAAVDSAAQPA